MKKLLITSLILFAAISSSFAYNNIESISLSGPGSDTRTVSIYSTSEIYYFCFWYPSFNNYGNGESYIYDNEAMNYIDQWVFNGTPQDPSDGGAFSHDATYSGYFNSISLYYYAGQNTSGAAGIRW